MKSIHLLATSALATMISPAIAQTNPPQAPVEAHAQTGSGLEEIIVTARRREERLQAVPLAVTAVSGAALQRQNILSTLDLPRVSPGLNVSHSGGNAGINATFSIRGQNQSEFLASSDPSVGLYFGDVLVQRTVGAGINIFDLSQVEVLKGPQGTLFGRNTTGGNVVFRPKLPTDDVEGYVNLKGGRFNLFNIEGAVNVPVADGVSLRIAGVYNRQDGYIEGQSPSTTRWIVSFPGDYTSARITTTPDSGHRSYGGRKEVGVRATLRIVKDGFENVTTATHLSADYEDQGYRLIGLRPGGPAATVAVLDGPANEAAVVQNLPFYQTRGEASGYSKVKYSNFLSNTTTVELSDEISIKNIIGFHKFDSENFNDVDGSNLPLAARGNIFYGHEFSDEFQVLGEMKNFKWIAGAYYFKEAITNVGITAVQLGSLTAAPRGRTPYTIYEKPTNTSASVFASGTLGLDGLVEGLSLTLGGRYSWDKREVRFGQYGLINATPVCALSPTSANYTDFHGHFDAARCTMYERANFSAFTYTGTLDWKVGQGKLVYLTTRKGYRSGGFGTRGTDPTGYGIFEPEQVRDVEGGLKADWSLGGNVNLRTNLAAYYQWYKDIQRLRTFRVCASCVNQTVVQNAARAEIYGGEFESVLNFGRDLELRGSIAIVRPSYKDYTLVDPVTGAVLDVTNTATFGNALRNQYSASARVRLPIDESIADPYFQIDYYRQSSYYAGDSITSDPQARVPAYQLVNARIDFNSLRGSNFDIGFAVSNVFGKKYIRDIFSLWQQSGYASSIAGEPRTWRVEARYRF